MVVKLLNEYGNYKHNFAKLSEKVLTSIIKRML